MLAAKRQHANAPKDVGLDARGRQGCLRRPTGLDAAVTNLRAFEIQFRREGGKDLDVI